ncbi:unnamed protein product [Schistocephalus solidus]|uniref:Uncharacterized protein n=1 Tax=Schistocephalus solidus TaxID=70667 RepID=A0A183T9W0_SCHSO|nr:unnamed protein product [Schistocephalus solidus]
MSPRPIRNRNASPSANSTHWGWVSQRQSHHHHMARAHGVRSRTSARYRRTSGFRVGHLEGREGAADGVSHPGSAIPAPAARDMTITQLAGWLARSLLSHGTDLSLHGHSRGRPSWRVFVPSAVLL